MASNDSEFRHDLIIASDDGSILHIPREVWDDDKYRIDKDHYLTNDGWRLVRELLECGVNLAAIPPKDILPPDRPEPEGTCYLVNIEGLKREHKFHRQRS